MKHLIILGDGMADHPVARIGGLTPMQYAHTPYMDKIACLGQCGKLITIPDGFQPGSEVANTAILGYDLDKVYEGRGPLEAASIGYEMQPDDLALRCNLVTLADGKIANHHGGHLTTEQGEELIKYLQQNLGSDKVKFISGIQYRHLLIIKGGNKHIEFCPPHDFPGCEWRDCLPKGCAGKEDATEGQMTAQETVNLINELILKSQSLLAPHPFNLKRKAENHPTANSIWPWGGGYRPDMLTLSQRYPSIRNGAVISAVDLIRGIGHYAGLDIIKVPGATGLADTNYEGKAEAAIEALRRYDFVFLHIEASDEAGHDGDLDLKLKTIEYLDSRIVKPIFEAIQSSPADFGDNVSIAILPDHPTPVEIRTHVNEPVPFVIWHSGIKPDSATAFDEYSCSRGCLGTLRLNEFMETFMTL